MNVQRGDVLKARFPHASGERGKKRPVVVVQADNYNRRLRHAVVAEVTGNLEGKGDPACLFVDSSTPAAQAAGLFAATSFSNSWSRLRNRTRHREPSRKHGGRPG